ncbi:MAG: squalene/phytoene synthase family protein [Rhodospirillales bacterium]|nr:squalene/phytoene synthase family protein [Rhodospirillales bacterium]MBT5075865.1 squalene/phytoene synthase family protein [Rhodospirillales bacterium]MBT5114229.1 squalene/phytoene synthase family protein [Rhodospirillales bacterium]MBT5673099.1 squalene/phytoene synthase family protein [Rhodospirillales bacterium]MBT6187385.1 squalene/phytoene synthase family protein [Rhodospirillales bacterium]
MTELQPNLSPNLSPKVAPGKSASTRSSFYWAMRILPRERRDGIYAVYGFCRIVDDIADGPGSLPEKQAGLKFWRNEIRALFANEPVSHGAAKALIPVIKRFDLHADDFLAIIEGMEMDAAERMLAPGILELELYCRRAAGAVGMLSASVFGLPRPEGRSLALSLGQALQFTNFLRDLGADAVAGRLYVPRQFLEAHGIESRDPKTVLAHPNFPKVAADMAKIADERFYSARRVLKACPKTPSRPARMMIGVYEDLLARLRHRGFAPDVIDQRLRLSRFRRLILAIKACLE